MTTVNIIKQIDTCIHLQDRVPTTSKLSPTYIPFIIIKVRFFHQSLVKWTDACIINYRNALCASIILWKGIAKQRVLIHPWGKKNIKHNKNLYSLLIEFQREETERSYYIFSPAKAKQTHNWQLSTYLSSFWVCLKSKEWKILQFISINAITADTQRRHFYGIYLWDKSLRVVQFSPSYPNCRQTAEFCYSLETHPSFFHSKHLNKNLIKIWREAGHISSFHVLHGYCIINIHTTQWNMYSV